MVYCSNIGDMGMKVVILAVNIVEKGRSYI